MMNHNAVTIINIEKTWQNIVIKKEIMFVHVIVFTSQFGEITFTPKGLIFKRSYNILLSLAISLLQ